MKIKYILPIALITGAVLFSGCDDFLTTNPSVELSDDIVLTSQTGLEMLLTGTYRKMKDGNGDLHASSPIGMKSYSTGVGSIDIASYPAAGNEINGAYRFLPSSYLSDGNFASRFFQNYYEIINNTNLLIANAHNAPTLENQIKGQALIIRARCYYNLVRLYQHTYIIAKNKPGVPLYIEPSDAATVPKGRASVEEVYSRIENDLKDAIALLADFNRPDWTYYDKDVAYFLLADMYLTKNMWTEARDAAMQITSKYPLMSNAQYKNGFCEKNDEWILGYKQTDDDNWYYNSIGCVWYWETGTQWNAKMFYPTTNFVENIITPSDARYQFRKIAAQPDWYISDKFNDRRLGGQPILSDMCDLRAAEMYLVEAEARAHLNDSQALTILNNIQTLRGGKVTTTSDNLRDAILLERRKELYGEGIDLWDVKRLQKAIKRDEDKAHGGHYYSADIPVNSNKLILQIPKYEMTNNPNIEQNPDPEKVPVFTP
ncbi:RagB/SusD family nutrient uptake outer membrane protein [Dysgonomonas termitidis]|uniref:RagB/SusD family nutrient uptake outer membrane protein n=1 Tax=Dysgonomonas termitidis TaxID=1516126 RepID=A0ABV9KUW4_9BACT